MNEVSREAIIGALRSVMDPELGKNIVSLEMVKNVDIDPKHVRIEVELTTPACPLKDQIRGDIERAVKPLAGERAIEVTFGAKVSTGAPRAQLPDVKNIISVGAGKGGVGKSTVATMLAVGLHRAGAAVGLLDADVYGPSLPTMLGLDGQRPNVRGDRIIPLEGFGIKTMSVGFLVEPDRPMVLRGPMLHGILRQFLEQVEWGPLDYLIVDLPPGTGDVPLSLAQSIPMTGSVIVCTPQDIALSDARRAVMMFRQLNIECVGIIENMSYYLCPQCGHRDELFAHGGAERAAGELSVPFLGGIPLNAGIRVVGDTGRPNAMFTDTPDYVQDAIARVVEATAGQVSIVNQQAKDSPTLTIE